MFVYPLVLLAICELVIRGMKVTFRNGNQQTEGHAACGISARTYGLMA